MWESILKIVIEAFLASFGKTLTDMVGAERAREDATARGRAEAQAEQARASATKQREIDDVAGKWRPLDEVMDKLERGEL